MWKGILRRVRQGIREDNVPLAAAGLSFYAVLAIFPALVAVVSLYGLVANPQAVERQVNSFSSRALPPAARQLLRDQLGAIVQKPAGSLNLGLFLSLALLLFSASAGTYALIRSLNIAYEVRETRRLLKLRATAFVLAIAAIVFVLLGLATIAVVPALFARLGVGDFGQALVDVLRWPVTGVVIVAGLALLYRIAPNRPPPGWDRVAPGAVVATLLWLVASILFSVYVSNFGRYDATYGALGGMIVLLVWLFISAFVILLGAELNIAIERELLPGPVPPQTTGLDHPP